VPVQPAFSTTYHDPTILSLSPLRCPKRASNWLGRMSAEDQKATTGPADGDTLRACCAALQTLICIVSVYLWSAIIRSPTCGAIPQFAELASRYFIILISGLAKLPINLQATPGPAWRALASLINLPIATASSRKVGERYDLHLCAYRTGLVACPLTGE